MRFDSLIVPDTWLNLDMSYPEDISNQELLSHFSYGTDTYCPGHIQVHELPLSDLHVSVKAEEDIRCDVSIERSVDLLLHAGSSIEFSSGFQIPEGATMITSSDCCN